MEKIELLRRALWVLVEIFSLGLVLLIFVYFLLGQSAGEFIVGLIGNIGVFAKATGENAIIAILIIISLVLYLNNKQR
ncbi:MAG: hypothetical protein QGH63_02770 [Rhodospirillales bacterium]|nr:hypothetical protein [Rhodospirillales bacterium]